MNVRRDPAAYTSETTLRTALARTAALCIHVPFRHPRFTTFRPGASFRSPGKAGLEDDDAAEEGAAFERGALEKGCPGRAFDEVDSNCEDGLCHPKGRAAGREKEMSTQTAPFAPLGP